MTLCHNLPVVLFSPLVFTAARDWRASPVWTCEPCQLLRPHALYASCSSCGAPFHWRQRRLQGVITGRTLNTFTRRLIEMSGGDSRWSTSACPFQYSICITSTRPLRTVSPFINCSEAKQTWATHSSSRQELLVFNHLINLFHQHLFVAATAVKCYCKYNIMLIIIAVRFLCLSCFFFPFKRCFS